MTCVSRLGLSQALAAVRYHIRASAFRKMSPLCLALHVVTVAQAQQSPPVVKASRVDFSTVEIKTTRHSDDFFTLEGHGGTISVLTGPDGVLMVDAQFAPLTDKVVAAIRKISDQPIRFLVDTHVHGDHTGGNENFAKTRRADLQSRPIAAATCESRPRSERGVAATGADEGAASGHL